MNHLKVILFMVNTVFFGEKTTSPVSIYIIVFFTFLLGVVLTGLYGVVDRFRIKKKIRVLTRELQEKDRELNSLRNLPITSDDVGTIKTESAQKE
jgi:biopolymer transport protein ExbB/TolQ